MKTSQFITGDAAHYEHAILRGWGYRHLGPSPLHFGMHQNCEFYLYQFVTLYSPTDAYYAMCDINLSSDPNSNHMAARLDNFRTKYAVMFVLYRDVAFFHQVQRPHVMIKDINFVALTKIISKLPFEWVFRW